MLARRFGFLQRIGEEVARATMTRSQGRNQSWWYAWLQQVYPEAGGSCALAVAVCSVGILAVGLLPALAAETVDAIGQHIFADGFESGWVSKWSDYEQPAACPQLLDTVQDSLSSTCSDGDYNRLADIENDGVVNSVDLALVTAHAGEDAWCSTQLADATNPCLVDTATAMGSVALSEIGGAALTVKSAWANPAAVGPDGHFSIPVSVAAPQLLLVADASGQARALGVSMPTGLGARKTSAVAIGAESTAVSLIMLTPGILTTDPAQAAARIADMETLPEFQTLVTALTGQLTSESLTAALQEPAVQEPLQGAIDAWFQKHAGSAATIAVASPVPDAAFAAGPPTATGAAAQITLTNSGWRFLSVHRREIDACGQTRRVTALHLGPTPGIREMSGREPISWGSIFDFGEPTSRKDVVDFRGLSEVEYWVQSGIGQRSGSLSLPPEVPVDQGDPGLMTSLFYLGFPILDLWLGSADLSGVFNGDLFDQIELVVSLTEASVDVSGLLAADTFYQTANALSGVLADELGLVVALGQQVALFGVSAAAWGYVDTILTVGTGILSAANMAALVHATDSLPRVSKVLVTNTAPPTCNTSQMVFVPAGEFTMGSDYTDQWYSYEWEKPVHTVYLDAFWIDRNEVTVDEYAACVDAAGCPTPNASYTDKTYCNWGSPRTGDNPINCVDWYHGQAYCAWAGKRYPTEAEWEKAARGTDARTYPWGELPPTCDYAVMYDPAAGGDGCGLQSTAPVGSKLAGASPYGALDMEGNAWQWVNDWYDPSYYSASPYANPAGPASSPYGGRVLRAASWRAGSFYLRASERNDSEPTKWGIDGFSFRCARDG